ncbi:hypothetical protein SAMN04487914_12353 [Arthrobacter sp. ok909]|uniref:hypothetical protein n=1 Tax=Arthrobacter sp. ok909 TaxID=1761746 RepID=UPI00088B4AB2|nr:hypothetical protein [Arthrobacter sp. ok909]SDP65160.1 hypothetical protein SAMN04487914_12353 [Arthrobacter sp. ok909]
MPLPPDHVHRLKQDLARHRDQLTRTVQQQMRLNTEIAVHNFVLNTAENMHVRALLDALADDPGLFARLNRDTAQVLSEYKVSVPDWVTVRVPSGYRAVRAEFSVNGSRFYVEWDTERGFDAGEDEIR